MARRYKIPEGLRVLADGSWRSGDQPVAHRAILRYLKSHLRFEDSRAFVVDGENRMPVDVEGPAFEVVSLDVDEAASAARLRLDDGTHEDVADDTLLMAADTGRLEGVVRGGGRAVLSHSAHQTVLDLAIEDDGEFYLPCGERRFRIRT